MRPRGRRAGNQALVALLTLCGLRAGGLLAAQGSSPQPPVLRVTGIELETARQGVNCFVATLSNTAPHAILAVVELGTTPGLWMLRPWQRRFAVELGPGETRSVEEEFVFERLSIEARLTVRAGRGSREAHGSLRIDELDFDTTYDVGAGNAFAHDPRDYFAIVERPPLVVYAWRGSAAERDVNAILERRLEALRTIADLLAVPPPASVRLVSFPNESIKAEQTGHQGLGWGFDDTLVEVYNDEIHLDPYHELAHVVAAAAGEPPAALDEGFATYASERVGADALQFLGSPGLSVDAVTCRAIAHGEFVPLGTLLSLREIGSEESNPVVTYPESASLVKHLIEAYGLSVFRELYSGLHPGAARDAARLLEEVTGRSPGALEAEWTTRVRAACVPEPGGQAPPRPSSSPRADNRRHFSSIP